jgi:hypothetical protein
MPPPQKKVPRILNPVVLVLDELPQLAKDPEIKEYMDAAFGEPIKLGAVVVWEGAARAAILTTAKSFDPHSRALDSLLSHPKSQAASRRPGRPSWWTFAATPLVRRPALGPLVLFPLLASDSSRLEPMSTNPNLNQPQPTPT